MNISGNTRKIIAKRAINGMSKQEQLDILRFVIDDFSPEEWAHILSKIERAELIKKLGEMK
jgi:hypothetical protein